jgi:protein-S-isoprenylcysteine O-methyltransferase Ste14
MQTFIYLTSAALLITAAYLIFNHVVAKDYIKKGRLGWWASTLQLAIFTAFFCFPYLYMPPEWAWDWLPNGTWNRLVALVLVSLGMLIAFPTMIWFGMKRAFGFEVKGIVTTGLYRYTRNPQMVGGWFMVLGVFVYLPSLYNLGWVLLWAIIGHWMVSNEEIHLRRVFGEEYDRYCEKTPRYLIKR